VFYVHGGAWVAGRPVVLFIKPECCDHG
jgi:acetyl esterase/lipase